MTRTETVDNHYTAQLHLVGLHQENGSIKYRTLSVGGLVLPHIEALEGARIRDAESDSVYLSPYDVPGIFAIDFPAGGNPTRHGNPDYQSHDKRQLYDQARQLGQEVLAAEILGTHVDAEMHSTHLVYDVDEAARPLFASASKFGDKLDPTPYLGKRLTAFTYGPGRKNLTNAFRYVISVASSHDLLPAPPAPLTVPVPLARLAVFHAAIADELLPISQAYLVENYNDVGEFVMPAQSQAFAPITQQESAALACRGIEAAIGKPLSRDAVKGLLRLRLDVAVTDWSAILEPYPINTDMTAAETAAIRSAVDKQLYDLPVSPQPKLNTATAEYQTYLAELQDRWSQREQDRIHRKV